MYKNFFGFKEKPFELSPDPKFLYLNKSYQETLAALIYGVRERRGFIAMVGEVGTGKTLMINALLERLGNDTKVAVIYNSDLTFRQIMMMALCDLGLANPGSSFSKLETIQLLNNFAISQLEENCNVVIIIDEAQNLSHNAMENLRMLSNLETPKSKLVQIVISGQPELDKKLKRKDWRQLVQRISIKRYSINLNEQDTYSYIQHRIRTAGYLGDHIFNEKANTLIWKISEGNPRMVNVICDNALLIGYGLGQKKINEQIVKEVIKDLTDSPFFDNFTPQT